MDIEYDAGLDPAKANQPLSSHKAISKHGILKANHERKPEAQEHENQKRLSDAKVKPKVTFAGPACDNKEEVVNLHHAEKKYSPQEHHPKVEQKEKTHAIPFVAVNDRDYMSIVSEVESFIPHLKETIDQRMSALERMTIAHSSSMDFVSDLKGHAQAAVQKLSKESTVVIQNIKNEAIKKDEEIQKMIKDSEESKIELTEQTKEFKNLAISNPELFNEKIQEANKLLQTLSKKIDDLVKLRESIYKKLVMKKNMIQGQVEATLDFYSDVETKARDRFEEKILKVVIKEESKAQSMDLCFMIDSTKSMNPYIRLVHKKIGEIIHHIKQKFKRFSVRISIVGYRDVDVTERFSILDFTDKVETAENFLENLGTAFSKDKPEDINGAFQKTLDLSWRSATKLLVHIADAPCHGKKFHELRFDMHSAEYKDDIPYDRIFTKLKAIGANYAFFKINETTDLMFRAFKKIYGKLGGSQNLFFVQDQICEDSNNFVELIARHIENSILSTLQQTYKVSHDVEVLLRNKEITPMIQERTEEGNQKVAEKAKMKEINPSLVFSTEVVLSLPKWEGKSSFESEISPKVYYIFNTTRLKNLANNDVGFTEETCQLQVCRKPFAKGGFQLAYYAIAKPSRSNHYYHMVVKRPIYKKTKPYYFSVLKKNGMAVVLADQFNKLLGCEEIADNERIYFNRILLGNYGKQFFLMEAFINGDIAKYTNNTTYVNESVPLMTAFSHFSYVYSKGKLMVADLQGHNNILTDPVIHSYNVEFSDQGDLGLKGMLAFFRNHRCNDYCRALKLGTHDAQNEGGRHIEEKPVKFDISKNYRKCKYYYCNLNSTKDDLCELCSKQANPWGE